MAFYVLKTYIIGGKKEQFFDKSNRPF